MKHIAIRFKPMAIVTFTADEAKFMLQCAECHYDAVCREAGKGMIPHDGNRPGFLRGIANCIATAGEEYTHKLTFRQIDTLAKIIENPPHNTKGWPRLAHELRSALIALNNAAMEDKPIIE